MIIGVPKEIKTQEHRVGLLPSGVYQLVKHGHQVLVERGAGIDSGYPTTITPRGREAGRLARGAFRADLIVKVKEPVASEYRCCARARFFSPICTSPPTAS
jgi:alanine dehydrogenase